MNEENKLAPVPDERPDRNNYFTLKEFYKELKYWEIRQGLYKPTRRDFKDEDEYKRQLAIYTRALNNKRV